MTDPALVHAMPSVLGADAVLGLGWVAAVDALSSALADGLDPESDPARTYVPLDGSGMWFMPSRLGDWSGAKVLTVTPANAARDLPTIQGVYIVSDGQTGAPRAILDGAALTRLRTAAVSALAVRHLSTGPLDRLVVFGTGVQADAHVDALVHTAGVGEVDVVGRSPHRVDELVGRLRDRGVDARSATSDAVNGADAVVCATGASTPVFDGASLASHAVVVAIGSHTADTREVDSVAVGRSQVFVESRARALQENGNVLGAIADGTARSDELNTIASLVRGDVHRDPGRPALFTGTGMGWQDLAIAAAIHVSNHPVGPRST